MNNLTNPVYIKSLMAQYQFKPKDYMGQNFLVDEIALQEILDAADIKSSDTIVEVGPGLGVLTTQLSKKAKKVLAIEKDQRLTKLLYSNLVFPNTTIVNEDILRFDLDKHIQGPYKVVANIPYYLTSHLFRYFLNQKNKPQSMTLLIQKEVGERVTAKAGGMSVLAVSVQLYAEPEITAQVNKKSFWPTPKVDSVVLNIVPKNKFPEIANDKDFFRVVKVGFSAKRKLLTNNLKNGLHLSQVEAEKILIDAKLDLKVRAQDLTIEDWIKVYKLLEKHKT